MNADIKKKLKAAFLNYTNPEEAAGITYRRPPDETATYPVSFAVDPLELFRPERFDQAEEKGILSRPQIVREMKSIIFDPKNKLFGLFVKGPQGVGKSHSLVNLVQTLRAEGHVVTFIPDSEHWIGKQQFMKAICRSIGTTMGALGLTSTVLEDGCFMEDFLDFIVSDCLEGQLNKNRQEEKDKIHWVLVFDQLNRIFARPAFKDAKDVGVLPEPFVRMKFLASKRNVHTVVSASANNSLSYKENHPGFIKYNHPLRMDNEEVKIWRESEYRNLDENRWSTMVRSTGLCPLAVSEYLQSSSREKYERETADDVIFATLKLMDESTDYQKKEIQKHAIHCLLHLRVTPVSRSLFFDKKYSYLLDDYFEPIFPAVLLAYRIVFWDSLLEYVVSNEAYLLETCSHPMVTNDVRGRLFELVVITRLQQRSIVSLHPEATVLPGSVDIGMVFETQELPEPRTMENNTLFIPKNSNFPAIDLVLKEGQQVWAIQVHVSVHDDVEPTFRSMCQEKGWFDSFDNIFLVYLSPSVEVRDAINCLSAQPSRVKHPRVAQRRPEIQVSAISKDEIECLRDIQWPSITFA